MKNDRRVKAAGPSTPVSVMGLGALPERVTASSG